MTPSFMARFTKVNSAVTKLLKILLYIFGIVWVVIFAVFAVSVLFTILTPSKYNAVTIGTLESRLSDMDCDINARELSEYEKYDLFHYPCGDSDYFYYICDNFSVAQELYIGYTDMITAECDSMTPLTNDPFSNKSRFTGSIEDTNTCYAVYLVDNAVLFCEGRDIDTDVFLNGCDALLSQ